MKRGIVCVSIAMMAVVGASSAGHASVQAKSEQQASLTECVTLRTTGADRLLTARWMFAVMATSPQIADLATVANQRKAELDKEFARLLVRLVNRDCIDQVRPLASEDLEGAFELAGRALGEVAMQELLGNPHVEKSIAAYTDYLSEDDFKPLMNSIATAQSK